MSSATSGSVGDVTQEKNQAKASPKPAAPGAAVPEFAATTSVAAEAEQGDGPAAASASASAVGKNSPSTRVASVVVGKDYAAAASEAGVAVVGPNSASAASKIGVVAVGPDGAAASSNAANGSNVTVHQKDAAVEPDTPRPKKTV
ncbi:hypothetical protein [Marinimicrobium agarilyticum]|uniref:hypothetical protein n=1 Tax=Marinimicrobium agarilyticum TaxID=306546 RepID=UPI000405FA3E|nr:hypothetical protein [Marinimicrobium agarilyticum]